MAVATVVLGLCTVPLTAGRAAPPVHGARVCTWGGTPTAPTGVFTADPGMKTRLADLGNEPMPMTPAGFGRFIADETEKWAKVIRAANIKPE